MLSEEKTYSQARQNLASTLDDVVDNNTVIVIKRRSGKDVALIAADELSSLMETVHLCVLLRMHDALDALEQSLTTPLHQ